MWGSSADAKNVPGLLNNEQRKELCDAIEWDESTGQSLLAPLDDLPPDIVNLHVTAKLNHGFVHLHDQSSDHNILSLMYDGLQGELTQRPHNFDLSVMLGALRVEDGTNLESQYRDIVQVKERAEEDPTMPVFCVQYQNKPLEGRADSSLLLRMRSSEIG